MELVVLGAALFRRLNPRAARLSRLRYHRGGVLRASEMESSRPTEVEGLAVLGGARA